MAGWTRNGSDAHQRVGAEVHNKKILYVAINVPVRRSFPFWQASVTSFARFPLLQSAASPFVDHVSRTRAVRSCNAFARCLASALFMYLTAFVHAAPGALDSSFGAGFGKVLLPRAPYDWATAVAVQTDRKIIVAGNCATSSAPSAPWGFCVTRLLASGAPDTSFGVNGLAIAPVPDVNVGTPASSVALLANGKVVVGGSCYEPTAQLNRICVARFNPDGSIDTTYGTSGVNKVAWGTQSIHVRSMVTQVDDHIVFGAFCQPTAALQHNLCAIRVTPNGQLDTTFGFLGGIGAQILYNNLVGGIAIQPDGKIVLSGGCHAQNPPNPKLFCAIRLLSNGQPDASFGTGGFGQVSFVVGANTSDAEASALVVQRDGKIIIGGRCRVVAGGPLTFCLLRLHADGTVDASYGPVGTIFGFAPNVSAELLSMTVQPDGKLIAGGVCYVTSGVAYDFCVARLHDDGTLDKSFSGDGLVITSVGSSEDWLWAIAIQPDGNIVAAGSCLNGAEFDYCVVRYEGGPPTAQQCSLDIDGDGKVLATVDGLNSTRIGLGITGPAVIGGVTFPPNAARSTWPDIRNFLVVQCGLRLP